ncbi:MAG: adenylate/guanylate cyclase domain-containing protein [Burkholderiales bacterium]|nr:adenylate/guanylate cyclase domain-containing protein [Burkholderiales bacterium]
MTSTDDTLLPTSFAVLFADVSGSTRLYDTVGDAAAMTAIGTCLEIFRERTEATGGRVIKTIGDEVMSAFSTADDAARTALQIQLRVDALAPVSGNKLGVRIGFHYGPAVERGDDLFGDTVNLASRLADVASRGQIILSLDTTQRLAKGLRAACRPLYAIPVKGKNDDIAICELTWKASADATAMMPSLGPSGGARAVLRLHYRNREIVLDETRSAITLGRDQGADVVVPERMASREHGRIEHRAGKFVLIDHSANGTYVTMRGDRELVLRREECVLRGRGVIALGQPRETAAELLEFVCD